MNLAAEGLALEWNGDCCPEPDMREFDPLKHQLVRFDESTPNMALRQTQFLQCLDSESTFGASTTNCHAYAVWVRQCLVPTCSIRWTPDSEELDEEDT